MHGIDGFWETAKVVVPTCAKLHFSEVSALVRTSGSGSWETRSSDNAVRNHDNIVITVSDWSSDIQVGAYFFAYTIFNDGIVWSIVLFILEVEIWIAVSFNPFFFDNLNSKGIVYRVPYGIAYFYRNFDGFLRSRECRHTIFTIGTRSKHCTKDYCAEQHY